MKISIIALSIALAAASATVPALAKDRLPEATQQMLQLKDGGTLHVFKDGKMAKEDRYGRAAYLTQGAVLELSDGRKVTAVGNEIARLHGLLNEGHGS